RLAADGHGRQAGHEPCEGAEGGRFRHDAGEPKPLRLHHGRDGRSYLWHGSGRVQIRQPCGRSAQQEVIMKPIAMIVGLLACTTPAQADDWRAWRGPDGRGHCAERGLPLKWSRTESVKWKVPLARPGNSTPIVSRGRVFLTEGARGGTLRSLLCFDRADG